MLKIISILTPDYSHCNQKTVYSKLTDYLTCIHTKKKYVFNNFVNSYDNNFICKYACLLKILIV